MNLSTDTIEYINRFYTPPITVYEILKYFFASLYIKDVKQIDRDLSDFFYKKKKSSRFTKILSEINFKNNGVFLYSNEIEDSILILQNIGLLGKKNPSFGIILIQYNLDIAKEFLSEISGENKSLIDEMANSFKETMKTKAE